MLCAVWLFREQIKAELILLIEFTGSLMISLDIFHGPGKLHCQHLLVEGITYLGSAIMLFIERNLGGLEWTCVLNYLADSQQETPLSSQTDLYKQ